MRRFFFAAVVALGLIGCRDETAPITTSSGEGGGDGDGDGDGGSSNGTGGADLPGGPLKVMNWNVRNMFDTKKDTTDEGENVPTQTQYDFKLDKCAQVIAAAAPQIVVLAEVENQAVLDDLATRAGSQYAYRGLIEGNDPRGIDVGILSTLPIEGQITHFEETFPVEGTQTPLFQFTRDLPEFHVDYNGQTLVFLAVHFRSKSGTDGADKRLAEAQRARAIADAIAAADPTAGIFLLGDFNDMPGSPPVEAVRQKAPPFFDATDLVPIEDRWTFDFQGALELIDHQFTNPVAAAWLDQASVLIDHSATAQTASDHSPVIATYNVP
jgi:predicted extracellular nuclease